MPHKPRLCHLCFMNLDLTGKTAVVCGSTQGIGAAIALELALLGAEVVLFARDPKKLSETAAALPTPSGQTHRWIAADFNHTRQVAEQIDKFTQSNSAQILINNTGGPLPGKAIEADIENFRLAFNAHLINNHILTRALLPGMKESGYGRIINIISTSVKQPLPNLGVSNTIRGAVANWAKTLATELGPYGITVNNVLPGATNTGRLDSIIRNKAEKTGLDETSLREEMAAEVPVGRLGQPEEIAAAVAFLASPAAAYINGINLPVDGGRTLSL